MVGNAPHSTQSKNWRTNMTVKMWTALIFWVIAVISFGFLMGFSKQSLTLSEHTAYFAVIMFLVAIGFILKYFLG